MKISDWHKLLNSEGFVPSMWHRRNKAEHSIVSDISLSISAFLSENWKLVDLYSRRAILDIEVYLKTPPSEEERKYIEGVLAYLEDLAKESFDKLPNSKKQTYQEELTKLRKLVQPVIP
ncbi:hypothetical protein [Pelagicoccus albus]|uniref:Uncharacterized protein n=1 Tax=Pelagicoccus albus TaxID=415222 RepID=A0A7X1B641_9BACT|nr:hypothetical protein [Pelagicoccus albus]MBC2606310.1 hypothetical protein [Pelagicoccus albus]